MLISSPVFMSQFGSQMFRITIIDEKLTSMTWAFQVITTVIQLLLEAIVMIYFYRVANFFLKFLNGAQERCEIMMQNIFIFVLMLSMILYSGFLVHTFYTTWTIIVHQEDCGQWRQMIIAFQQVFFLLYPFILMFSYDIIVFYFASAQPDDDDE